MYQTRLDSMAGFNVLHSSKRSQAATMVLAPGETVGDAQNRHADADQWLYVVSGNGQAHIGDEAVDLQPGKLVLIEAGETHRIDNAGDAPLETLNFYAPPEY